MSGAITDRGLRGALTPQRLRVALAAAREWGAIQAEAEAQAAAGVRPTRSVAATWWAALSPRTRRLHAQAARDLERWIWTPCGPVPTPTPVVQLVMVEQHALLASRTPQLWSRVVQGWIWDMQRRQLSPSWVRRQVAYAGGLHRVLRKATLVPRWVEAPKAPPDLRRRLLPNRDGPWSTRMIKLTCPACGYLVRTTRRWLAAGPPTCPCGTPMDVAWAVQAAPTTTLADHPQLPLEA